MKIKNWKLKIYKNFHSCQGKAHCVGLFKRYRSKGWPVGWNGLYRPALGGKPSRRKQEIFMKSLRQLAD